jgi:hypothetical protein
MGPGWIRICYRNKDAFPIDGHAEEGDALARKQQAHFFVAITENTFDRNGLA